MEIIQNFAENVAANIETVIVGKRSAVDLAVICLLCQGHLLIEDVPGVGKTVLAQYRAIIGVFIQPDQFTPDMLPSDVTGFRFSISRAVRIWQ
jgi:MoxR-like ATPase